MADYEAFTLTLADGSAKLELLLEFGGAVNALELSDVRDDSRINIIAGLSHRAELQNNSAYRGVPLFPVVNRLDGGRYTHRGKHYHLAINEPERNNHLHGFLHTLTPTVADHRVGNAQSSVALQYHYDGRFDGYPFPASVVIEYTLTHDALTVTFAVHNLHDESIPAGMGWHPYFHLECPVDQLQLQLPSVERIGVDERMLPTGETCDFDDFKQLTDIGTRQLDTCFRLAKSWRDKPACAALLLWSKDSQRGIEVWQHSGPQANNYVQLCIAPDRLSIAIEPVSCNINALNTGDGLVHIEPGCTWVTSSGVKLTRKARLS